MDPRLFIALTSADAEREADRADWEADQAHELREQEKVREREDKERREAAEEYARTHPLAQQLDAPQRIFRT